MHTPSPNPPDAENNAAPLHRKPRHRWVPQQPLSPGGNPAHEARKTEHALLATEAGSGRHQQSLYELFSEMEQKDGTLYSLIQTRINALLGLEYNLELPTGTENNPLAAEAHAFVRSTLSRFPRWKQFLRSLLDALPKGFAVVELHWGYDAEGRLIVEDWRAHKQESFAFSLDPETHGELMLLSPPFATSTPAQTGTLSPAVHAADTGTLTRIGSFGTAHAAPARKFLLLQFGCDARNPFGRGLCQHAYWYYWFKKNTLRSWGVFNEKYGAPLAVARVQPDLPTRDRDELLRILDSIQTDAGVVIPNTMELDYLHAGQAGDGACFERLADWCNAEMARIVLGATLSTGEGKRSGSMALGRVHEHIRQDYLEADARLLETLFNTTLIPWLVEINFGESVPVPEIRFNVSVPEDMQQQLQIDLELIRLGLPISTAELYRRYGRQVPTKSEPMLSHDDSNIFQYHLRFGILTINEVRKRLQLPAVPWGDQPTSRVLQQEAAAEAALKTGTQNSAKGDGVTPEDREPTDTPGQELRVELEEAEH
ncbi:MAG: DUF935 family protein [Candidatus Sumerlaeia bacterium]|nr:DUF935 family protein [Candidatus Sumerlaeia bacterium]